MKLKQVTKLAKYATKYLGRVTKQALNRDEDNQVYKVLYRIKGSDQAYYIDGNYKGSKPDAVREAIEAIIMLDEVAIEDIDIITVDKNKPKVLYTLNLMYRHAKKGAL